MIDVTVKPSGPYGDTFQAIIDGVIGVSGSGKTPESAIGDCLRTAHSLEELSGFQMPEGYGFEMNDTERGAAALAGQIPGVAIPKIINA